MSHDDPCAGIRSRIDQLVCRLRYATELEQQFMCMYLYAAFSIQKRYVNHQKLDVKPAQQEISRRWASTVYLVARQEMEHLALANNLLRSIGGAPCFARSNLPDVLQHFHLGANPRPEAAKSLVRSSAAATSRPVDCDQLEPIAQHFKFTRFDLDAVKRWTCMEAPDCEALAANDADQFADWCFRRKTALRGVGDTAETVYPGTITEWYEKISHLFAELPASDFVLSADNQVDILQQYNIFVFPVTDNASAQQAIDLIAEQGEGISASPTYPSHYRRFYDITREWQDNGGDAGLQAYWNVAPNPTEADISNEFTREMFCVFNSAYETLLIMLTGLYATLQQSPGQYPFFAPSLGQEAFAPYMTMVIRSLAEVLVQLRTDQTGVERVGPGFHISDELNAELRQPYADNPPNGMAGESLKEIFSDIDQITNRIESVGNRLETLIAKHESPPVVDEALSEWAVERIKYIHVNAKRIAVNVRRIYQQGIYSALQGGGY